MNQKAGSAQGRTRKLTKDDLARVTGRLLVELSRAGMIPGCCTQGCCDESVLELISQPAPKT